LSRYYGNIAKKHIFNGRHSRRYCPLLVISYNMYTRLCEMPVWKASEYARNYEEFFAIVKVGAHLIYYDV
jgi:hypothetical protein